MAISNGNQIVCKGVCCHSTSRKVGAFANVPGQQESANVGKVTGKSGWDGWNGYV